MPIEKSYTYTGVDADGNPVTKTELIYSGVTWTPTNSAGNRKRLHFETDTDAVVSLTNGKTLTTLMAEDLEAAKKYTDDKIKDLIGVAPSTLDTLEELAEALTSNKEVIDTLNNSILNKLDTSIYDEFINGKDAVGNVGDDDYQPAVPGYSEWKAGVDASILKLEGDMESVIGNTGFASRLNTLEKSYDEFINGKAAVGNEGEEGYQPEVIGFNEWKASTDASINSLKELTRGTSIIIGTADIADADVKDTDLYLQIV